MNVRNRFGGRISLSFNQFLCCFHIAFVIFSATIDLNIHSIHTLLKFSLWLYYPMTSFRHNFVKSTRYSETSSKNTRFYQLHQSDTKTTELRTTTSLQKEYHNYKAKSDEGNNCFLANHILQWPRMLLTR
ncbi:unnamed protein product [Albugo candida]|uniref:Uncharacterized protein n=1 Tax=Albugo candida TaxID=65357 RepID=A0A024GAF7_9STRA|nr:unnamed protein product [Albugo candida]|eukprot:CCI43307.1 unnamed protein product [Albugo candida]